MSEEVQSIDVYEYLTMIADQLAGVAWAKMGLQPDPMTGKIGEDFPQAKVAIDAVSALIDIISPALDEEDRRQTQNVKMNLKMNYVQKTQ